MPRKALGRGLGALIPGEAPQVESEHEVIERIALDRVKTNPMQPRTSMDEAGLAELADSIRERGLVQPIVVRRAGYYFEIIAGERRWLAARRLGMADIPAVIKDVPDDQLLELALVENIQREDLNPIDEARAYQKLIEILGITQEAVAARVGKDRTTVSNSLRLLLLPEEIQSLIAARKLTAGHARALLALGSAEEMVRLAHQIVAEGLTVRTIEELARVGRKPRHKGRRTKRRVIPELVHIEEQLERRLATRVRVHGTQHKGSIAIEYYSMEDLERIIEALGITVS
ncbi:MAG TPA: ParB/RepB/Spo0J family partition protein [Candidatus Saccharimonadales bacterium]|nr:ParB/RepB/Spo0J family partition protein [Candidatus Saccharimonadales bacterium]